MNDPPGKSEKEPAAVGLSRFEAQVLGALRQQNDNIHRGNLLLISILDLLIKETEEKESDKRHVASAKFKPGTPVPE